MADDYSSKFSGAAFPARIGAALFLVTAVAQLTACGPLFRERSDLRRSLPTAAEAGLDPETARASEAMHHYLMGELSYDKEDFTSALQHFENASKRLEDPAPILNGKLAELYLRGGRLEEALEESSKAVAAEPNNSYLLLLHAGVLEALERRSEAEPIYRRIIQEHPEQIEPYLLLYALYAQQNDTKRGIEVLRSFAKSKPLEPLAHFYLAKAEEEAGQLAVAEKHLRQALRLDPRRSNFSIELVRVLLKARKVDAAKKVCEELLAIDPENIQARRLMGHLLIGESRFEEALTHLQVLGSLEADPALTRFKIALIHIERRNFNEAIRELSLVIAADPNHEQARYYLGSSYAAVGNYAQAISEMSQIKEQSELYVQSRTLLSFMHRQQGQLSEAIDAMRDAYGKSPEDRQVVSYLNILLRDARRYREAEEILAKALEGSPADEKLIFQYAVTLYDLGRTDRACEKLEQLLQSNPRHADALNFLAYHFAEQGTELERAADYANRALKEEPDNGYYLDTLGWVQFKRGDYQQAVNTLTKAAALVTNDMVIIEHLGDAYLALGNVQEAYSKFQAALQVEHDESDPEVLEAKKRIKGKSSELSEKHPELLNKKIQLQPKIN